MKAKATIGATLVLCLAWVTGCVANQPTGVVISQPTTAEESVVGTEATSEKTSQPTVTATTKPRVLTPEEIVPERPGLDLRGQAITGHRVFKRWGNMDKMTFTVAKEVPSKNTTWAFICDELADGQVPEHVSFFWHGDNSRRWIEEKPRIIIDRAKQIRSDTCWVIPYRPHSRSVRHFRSKDEMRYHLALVDYFITVFGVEQLDVYGSSGGGTVAAMILLERRRHIKFAGLASPILAVKARRLMMVDTHWAYDPHYYIRRLTFHTPETQDVCILVVWDPRDRILKEQGVLPYMESAKGLGLDENQVRLVRVKASSQERHLTHRNLGQEMRELQRQSDGFCI